jgi:flagellar hook assembly protein FlgD
MYELNARPNPFRTHTSFFIDPRFLSPDQAVRVHDIRGGLVTALTFEENGLGHGEVEWDGNDFFGRAVAPGTYLVKTPENEALTIIKLP